ncbi:hypothetical protein CsSME_00012443 [Camellia sinensis var. sinensis]
MEVLAVVQNYLADRATTELTQTKSELEVVRHKAVLLEFELVGEQKKEGKIQQAYTTAKEMLEKALVNNEELRNQAIKEKEEAEGQIADLEKALAKERVKLASERAAYPDLCVAAMEQFKGSAEFQMAIDATVARSLAKEGEWGVGPSGVAAEGRSEEEVIQSFQRSDFYKHKMSQYWDCGWISFKYKAQELFPDVNFSRVKVEEDDIAQTPLDEGIEEEDLASSEGD